MVERAKPSTLKKGTRLGLVILIWVITAWLVYPLVTLESVNIANAKNYLYRSALGIAIMLILFGKTVFDLLFPRAVSQRMSVLNTVFLTLYCLAIASGIMFMVSRMIVVYIKSSNAGFSF